VITPFPLHFARFPSLFFARALWQIALPSLGGVGCDLPSSPRRLEACVRAKTDHLEVFLTFEKHSQAATTTTRGSSGPGCSAASTSPAQRSTASRRSAMLLPVRPLTRPTRARVTPIWRTGGRRTLGTSSRPRVQGTRWQSPLRSGRNGHLSLRRALNCKHWAPHSEIDGFYAHMNIEEGR